MLAIKSLIYYLDLTLFLSYVFESKLFESSLIRLLKNTSIDFDKTKENLKRG